MKPSEYMRGEAGWGQHYRYTLPREHNRDYCGSGTGRNACIFVVFVGTYGDNDEKINDGLKSLADHLGVDDNNDLQRWNDTPGRTKEEVIATLEAVGL